MTKKSHSLLGFLALGATVLTVGCAAHVQAGGAAQPDTLVALEGRATLVAISDHVWVVRDSDRAIYYVDDAYWVYDQGRWSRSRSYDGGWAGVEVAMVPGVLVSRDHAAYVHYKGTANAETRPAPRGEAVAVADNRAPPAVGNPHGGPPGHNEVPGVGNGRKAEVEPPAAPAAAPAKVEANGPKKESPSGGTPPGVGNARKSVGAQPGQVGNGGASAPASASTSASTKKPDKK